MIVKFINMQEIERKIDYEGEKCKKSQNWNFLIKKDKKGSFYRIAFRIKCE